MTVNKDLETNGRQVGQSSYTEPSNLRFLQCLRTCAIHFSLCE